MMTAVQGIVAAGTVAWLTREATWEKMALSSNHLFYLVGIAANAAAVDIPHFSLAAKAVFVMTPVVLFAHLYQGQESTPKAKAIGYYFNPLFYAAAVASTVVLVAFGHTVYGVGFFSVVALDMNSRSNRVNDYVKTALEWSANVLAMATFATYASKLATPSGKCLIMLMYVQIFVPRMVRIIKHVESLPRGSGNTVDCDAIRHMSGYSDLSKMRLAPAAADILPSRPVARREPDAKMQGWPSLMGPLPHDL
jgi:hypothetical protein